MNHHAVHLKPELTYQYAAGRYGSIFLAGLKEKKICASHCTKCKRTLVPPRIACTSCFGKMDKIVEVPPTATLLAFTLVSFPFLDPFTGVKRPIPYCYGMVQFEGTDNNFQYFLSEKNTSKLKLGMKMIAVFKEARNGRLDDILYFSLHNRS